MPTPLRKAPRLPVKLGTVAFARDAAAHFRWMHAHAPVCRAEVSVMKVVLVAGYDDCREILKDPRFVRDRRKAGGKSKAPIPPLPPELPPPLLEPPLPAALAELPAASATVPTPIGSEGCVYEDSCNGTRETLPLGMLRLDLGWMLGG